MLFSSFVPVLVNCYTSSVEGTESLRHSLRRRNAGGA